jgi:phosphoribosylformylglycinamidine cyclo-ligase
VSVTPEPKPVISAYQAAGVDIAEGERAVARIRSLARRTFTPRVESEIGVFAGFFSFPEPGSDRLLVASMDGVGTKLKLAAQTARWRGVGCDLVCHCVNDILVHGARPLFFLDYIGAGKLSGETVAELVEGMSSACLASGCALLGGETAEMPGMYPAGELDLVGTIVGEVKRSLLVDGRAIVPTDRILALPSSGLHTNGYSLARKIIGSDDNPAVLQERIRGDEGTLADLLLEPHRMYLHPVLPLVEAGLVHGMAHITGGGVAGNLPRVLPAGVRAVVRRGLRPVPGLFQHLVAAGNVDEDEAWRVFNMGVGFLLVVPEDRSGEALERLAAAGAGPWEIGWTEEGPPGVRWV